MSTLLSVLAGFGASLASPGPAGAQTVPAAPSQTQTPLPTQIGPATDSTPVNDAAGILQRDKLLGTMGGIRPLLEQYGITLGLTESSEVLGNVTGGRATGLVYEGVTTASVEMDLGTATKLTGGTIRISAFQIHGRGLSTNYVNNLNIVSSAEATRATRLFELWYQQAFFGGKADIRLGQQSADLEFATSTYAGLFVNGSFGWPTPFAVSLPGGGPSYPLGVLGARLQLKPTETTTMLLAVFNGSPARPGIGDPQLRNPSGTSFRLNDGVFAIGEIQQKVGSQGEGGRPGTYKLGGWYNSRAFTNQFYTSTIGSIDASATPANPNDNWMLYAVADQLVWPKPGTKDGGVGVFARITGGPGSRNQVNVSGIAGVTYKGPFGRDDDTVGLGVSWARISDTARAFDREAAAQTTAFSPIRSSEVALELTYQVKPLPWLTVQPVFQYYFSPGGGIVNPDHPDRRIGDAAVLGVRGTIVF